MTLTLQDRGKLSIADCGTDATNGCAGVGGSFSNPQTTRLDFWFWSFYGRNWGLLLSEMRHGLTFLDWTQQLYHI
jgi:hypothetical protein